MQREFRDQMHRHVTVDWPPRRIVSLVPSQTELLFDLGAGGKVVGVTDFCIEPPEALELCARVGGTKRFLFDRIEALSPDLLIGNREENYREGIARLETCYPVWMSDIDTLDDALGMIESVGDLCDCAVSARALSKAIKDEFAGLPEAEIGSAAYLIWRKPWMAVGHSTFIDAMLRRAGFSNVFANLSRYPEVTLDDLRARQPRFVLLSTEPFPFDEGHAAELAGLLPDSRVLVVDAMPYSWYGSRLRAAPASFRALRERCRA